MRGMEFPGLSHLLKQNAIELKQIRSQHFSHPEPDQQVFDMIKSHMTLSGEM